MDSTLSPKGCHTVQTDPMQPNMKTPSNGERDGTNKGAMSVFIPQAVSQEVYRQ